MKKQLFKILFMFLIVVPMMAFFVSCGKKDDDSQIVNVSSISVILSEDSHLNFDSATNTIKFEYGTEIVIEKDDFVVTALFDDDSSDIVDDFSIKLSDDSKILDVGNYEAVLKYDDVSVKFNVEVYPKAIEKPTTIQLATIFRGGNESVKEYSVGDIISANYRYDQISGYENVYEFRFVGFDSSMINILEESTTSSSQAGEYQVIVEPTSNYVWSDYEVLETEEISFDWNVYKSSVYMSSPETLEFEYDGEIKTINFINRPSVSDFNDFFVIIDGTFSASEKGKYSFTVSLVENKKNNYTILETKYKLINLSGVGDFKYNKDKTEITYYWEIV